MADTVLFHYYMCKSIVHTFIKRFCYSTRNHLTHELRCLCNNAFVREFITLSHALDIWRVSSGIFLLVLYVARRKRNFNVIATDLGTLHVNFTSKQT